MKLRATKKNYHKVEVWEKGQKKNSHEKVSQSLILLRTHMHIHSSTHTHAHMDTKFLLFCTV